MGKKIFFPEKAKFSENQKFSEKQKKTRRSGFLVFHVEQV